MKNFELFALLNIKICNDINSIYRKIQMGIIPNYHIYFTVQGLYNTTFIIVKYSNKLLL